MCQEYVRQIMTTVITERKANMSGVEGILLMVLFPQQVWPTETFRSPAFKYSFFSRSED